MEFFLSKDKLRYLRTHFIFLLVAIPYQNIIEYYHIITSPELSYFLRFVPLVRGGYALAIVVGWLSYNKASGLFVSYLTMLLATVYFSSLIFFVLEHKVNPLVANYGDALWWAFMDVTTVGSNISAITVTGRVLSVVLAALGMMMFPIFTVYVTSLVQKSNEEKKRMLSSPRLQQFSDAVSFFNRRLSGGIFGGTLFDIYANLCARGLKGQQRDVIAARRNNNNSAKVSPTDGALFSRG